MPVVVQRQVPTAFRCLQRPWKNSGVALFALGPMTLFLLALVPGKHLLRCFRVSLRLLLEEFHFVSALRLRPRRSHIEIWTLLLRSLVGRLFLRNSWLGSGYMFLVTARFLVNVSSDPVVDSRPALQTLVLQQGEVCTVDASIAWSARAYSRV